MDRHTPPEFLCPISLDIMTNPVVCEDGHTYENSVIQQWLATNPTSPTTRQPMSPHTIRPNYALKAAINRWKQQQQQKQTPTNPYIIIPVAPPTALTTPLLTRQQPTQRRSRINHCHPVLLFLYAFVIGVFIFMWHEGMFGN
jgi:hypothetical protein